MYVWGKGPLLLVTLLVGADSKTAPGKGPGKKTACMPACLPTLKDPGEDTV